jgi:hypothetical protein
MEPITSKAVHSNTLTNCIKCRRLTDVVEPGQLYFCSDLGLYALIVGDRLLYGNVGKIFNVQPKKIKDCKFKKCTYSNCNYYHDPIKHPGSNDVRNYVSINLYNKSTITNDIDANNFDKYNSIMSQDERRLFMDRAFHNLLIAFRLNE